MKMWCEKCSIWATVSRRNALARIHRIRNKAGQIEIHRLATWEETIQRAKIPQINNNLTSAGVRGITIGDYGATPDSSNPG